MNRCIAKQMLVILAKGLWETIVICGALAVIFGLPALLIWEAGRTITRLWGERAAYELGGMALLCFIVFALVMAAIDLYNRAKKECQ